MHDFSKRLCQFIKLQNYFQYFCKIMAKCCSTHSCPHRSVLRQGIKGLFCEPTLQLVLKLTEIVLILSGRAFNIVTPKRGYFKISDLGNQSFHRLLAYAY